jgi:hypothetical protein
MQVKDVLLTALIFGLGMFAQADAIEDTHVDVIKA